MKVVAFIEPPQGDVIEKVLRHCGLCGARPRRGHRPPRWSFHGPDEASGEPQELTCVDIDTFMATF